MDFWEGEDFREGIPGFGVGLSPLGFPGHGKNSSLCTFGIGISSPGWTDPVGARRRKSWEKLLRDQWETKEKPQKDGGGSCSPARDFGMSSNTDLEQWEFPRSVHESGLRQQAGSGNHGMVWKRP